MLKQLENELQYRQVPRAVALLAEVQAAMYGGAPDAFAAFPGPVTTEPLFPPDPQTGQPTTTSVIPTREPPPNVLPRPATVLAASPKPPSPLTAVVSVDDAYRLLKATPTSTWESIEQTRRQMVQQAHPSRVASLSQEKPPWRV